MPARGLDDRGRSSLRTARIEWIAAPSRTRSLPGRRASIALGPRVDGAVAEALLPGVQLDVAAAVEPALEVARVQHGEPDARLLGGLSDGKTHGVRVAEGLAARPMVHVVELADEGEAGQDHLGEDGAGQRVVGVGVELGGARRTSARASSRSCRLPR